MQLPQVISTIAAYAKAIQKDVIWKPLNHRLLLLTRHKYPCVKMVAVIALRRLFQEVGDEYLLLLPECLPYISELLEGNNTSHLPICDLPFNLDAICHLI